MSSSSDLLHTERVAGYLVQKAGLQLVTPASFGQSIEDGTDPSPSDVAAMDRAMTARTVRLLLYNAQVTSPTTPKVRDLATTNGIPVVGVAETIPAGQPTFQAWQIAQAKQILTALGGVSSAPTQSVLDAAGRSCVDTHAGWLANPALVTTGVGSAIAGPVVGHSLPIAFIAAVLVDVVAGVAAL